MDGWVRACISVKAVEVALEDALAHGRRGPARATIGGTGGGTARGPGGPAVTAKGERVLGRTDSGVRRCVGRGALSIRGVHEAAGGEGGAEGEAAQEALAALGVGIGNAAVRILSEATGNRSAGAAGM
jgi:hypothetical protein